MEILSHRGLWEREEAKNTRDALTASLEHGFGFESDLRDFQGKLVISHNPADRNSCPAEWVFQKLQEYKDQYCFAINIKADGLKEQLAELLEQYEISRYFCFDMSVPQMIEYARYGIRFFTRRSEYEPEPLILYEQAAGVWVDAFENESWITKEFLESCLDDGKDVCLVSPELHGRSYLAFWKRLREWNVEDRDNARLFLCTDVPAAANEFFGGKTNV